MSAVFGKEWQEALFGNRRTRADGTFYWLGQHRAFRPPHGVALDGFTCGSEGQAAAHKAVADAVFHGINAGVVLLGPTGTGKTFLMAARYASAESPKADEPDRLWINWHTFARLLLSDREWRKSAVIDELMSPGVVVIDDLALPRCADEAELFSTLVMERYSHWAALSPFEASACMSLTTNLTALEIKQSFGERVLDRLRESALWLNLPGKSLRRTLNAQELAKFRLTVESADDDDEGDAS